MKDVEKQTETHTSHLKETAARLRKNEHKPAEERKRSQKKKNKLPRRVQKDRETHTSSSCVLPIKLEDNKIMITEMSCSIYTIENNN